MRKETIFLILILSFFLVHLSFSQCDDVPGRNVFWVHGLNVIPSNDPADSWEIYENMFECQRVMRGFSDGYPSQDGVLLAADNVQAQMIARLEDADSGSSTLNANSNIGIGHSMGGIVLREMDSQFTGSQQRFGGLITIGTPHQGGEILNSISNGLAEEFTNDACDRLTDPLTAFPGVFGTGVIVFVGTVTAEVIVSEICQLADQTIIGPLLPMGQTSVDLASESEYIANMDPTPNVPIISMWGGENTPVLWRLVGSTQSSNGEDRGMVGAIDFATTLYQDMFLISTTNAIITFIAGFEAPILWARTVKATRNAIKWERGWSWLRNSEQMWGGLIGCYQYAQTMTGQITVDPCDESNPLENPYSYVDCSCDHCDCECSNLLITQDITITNITDRPSDGLFCDYSQILGYPLPVAASSQRAAGVNHFQEINTTQMHTENNNDEMQERFNEIWNTFGFFQTDTR